MVGLSSNHWVILEPRKGFYVELHVYILHNKMVLMSVDIGILMNKV